MELSDEWNIWRGQQTATLKLVADELKETNKQLREMKKEFYVLKGKSMAYGGLAGLIVGGIVSLVVAVLMKVM